MRIKRSSNAKHSSHAHEFPNSKCTFQFKSIFSCKVQIQIFKLHLETSSEFSDWNCVTFWSKYKCFHSDLNLWMVTLVRNRTEYHFPIFFFHIPVHEFPSYAWKFHRVDRIIALQDICTYTYDNLHSTYSVTNIQQPFISIFRNDRSSRNSSRCFLLDTKSRGTATISEAFSLVLPRSNANPGDHLFGNKASLTTFPPFFHFASTVVIRSRVDSSFTPQQYIIDSGDSRRTISIIPGRQLAIHCIVTRIRHRHLLSVRSGRRLTYIINRNWNFIFLIERQITFSAAQRKIEFAVSVHGLGVPNVIRFLATPI